MDDKKQKKNEKEQAISPLSQEMTYGERKHSFIFNNLINFWVNLGVSALFTYWVTHYQKPIKMGPIEFSPPSIIQEKLAGWFYKRWPMGVFGQKNADFKTGNTLPGDNRGAAATNLANVFTLVAAGHPIMIGSVWLGAKIKAPLVKWFNRRHYGDAAMESDDLQARHAAIEMEERPTLLGAVLGRLGTIFATQVVGYSIGNQTNALSWLGKRVGFGFLGIDKISGIIGNNTGEAFQEIAPATADCLNKFMARDGKYNWSKQQIKESSNLGVYTNVPQHLFKYLAQDVIYATVTAMTINPAINFLKQYIPGLTYTPTIRLKDEASDPVIAKQAETIHLKPNRIADETEQAPATKVLGGKVASPLMVTSPPLEQQARA